MRALFAFALLLTACGSPTSRTLGDACDDDTQCQSGLTCKANFVANQCTTIKTCTKDCAGDTDCQSLDPRGKCFQGCGMEKICMLAG